MLELCEGLATMQQNEKQSVQQAGPPLRPLLLPDLAARPHLAHAPPPLPQKPNPNPTLTQP